MPDITLCFNRALRRSAAKLKRLYDSALAPYGLSAFEFGLLSTIQARGTVGIVELADLFQLDRATLRYKLLPLERSGLVAYAINPRDRRSRRIGATSTGIAKLAETRAPWEAMQARVEKSLGGEEAAAMRATAERIASFPTAISA